MTDFYSIKLKQLQAEKSMQRSWMTDVDRELITRYLDDKKGIIPATRYHQTSVLCAWKRYMPVPYDQLDADRLREGTRCFDAAKSIRGAPFMVNTRNTMYRHAKSFIRWLVDEGVIKIRATDIKKILKAPAYDCYTERKPDLLTPNEIARIIDACDNPRDRALFAVLSESGARVNEVAKLRWKDLVFDNDGGVETNIVDDKTHNVRTVWLETARPYLAVWKRSYPVLPVLPSNLVFISRRRLGNTGGLTYVSINQILKVVVKKAKITKRVHLHLFRKSRATQMALDGYSDRTIKRAIWGRETSKMADVYIQLSGADVLDDMKRHSGAMPAPQPPEPKVVRCAWCQEVNPVGAGTCLSCGRDPAQKTSDELVRQLATALAAKPEVQALLDMMIAGVPVRVGVPVGNQEK